MSSILQNANRHKYLFCSLNLGFRNWQAADLNPFIQMNKHQELMRYFPSTLTENQSRNFVARMQKLFQEKGYCYFAVEELSSGNFIGFIGLCDQDYDSFFTPCVDIGWRLAVEYWNKGYATEGAKACLGYAFNQLSIREVYAVAPEVNRPSIRVMEKAGMLDKGCFEHPQLLDYPLLKLCRVFYASKFNNHE